MSDKEQRLIEILRNLPEAEAGSLLDYAEFLHSRAPQNQLLQALSSAAAMKGVTVDTPVPVSASKTAPAPENTEPVNIPRPKTESIIGAVKRLSKTYPMLSKDKMLHETADLVGQSLMGTRDSEDVIDELEEIFQRHYEKQFGQPEST